MSTISALGSVNPYLSNPLTTDDTTTSTTSTTSTTTKTDAMNTARAAIAATSSSLCDDLNASSSNDTSPFFEDTSSISEQAQSLLDAYNNSLS